MRTGAVHAVALGGIQFNKTPPEVTYINRTNTKRKYPTCKKPKEGANNLQKYQTDDQRKVKYEGTLRKGDVQKVREPAFPVKHASGAFGPGADLCAHGNVPHVALERGFCRLK